MEQEFKLIQNILLGLEGLAALVGLMYFWPLRYSHFKWFAVYLMFIFCQELYWRNFDTLLSLTKTNYYNYIGIPVQYLFFYWLFALKSLKKRLLFVIFTLIYLISLPLKLYFNEGDKLLYSFNMNLGTAILVILIIMEFMKQIKNDNIINFKSNRMFYINAGVFIFYIGSYPLQIFYDVLLTEYYKIWYGYFWFFWISNCIMYVLFTLSFIWGKERS